MLEKYRRLTETCQPYAVVNERVRPFCDLAPFGLQIPPENLLSPFTRASDGFLDALQWLDRMTFGFAGMEFLFPPWYLGRLGNDGVSLGRLARAPERRGHLARLATDPGEGIRQGHRD